MEVVELEKGDPTFDEVFQLVNGKRQKKCYDSGDTEGGVIPCGEVVGRIHDIPTVQAVIDEIVGDTEALLEKMVK